MKQILSLAVLALFMSACQSESAKNENANFPSSESTNSASDRPTHNPAHGQPFHDCSLAVGAPLVVKEAAVGADGKELKLNPAHGQPGHRCDIAVGSPLT